MILSIIIPAFNEEKTIRHILERVIGVELLYGIKKEVIVIDDCSTDATVAEVNKVMETHQGLMIKLVRHSKNEGKGSALHSGIKLATGDFIVIQDADLEYDPNEYNALLKPIIENMADVVYGSRFMGGNPHRIMFFWHSIGNRFLTFISNMLTNMNLTDMETCYKLFRREIIQSLELKEKRFGFEPEVTARLSRLKHVRIYEVGISYYGRTFAEGKKIGWKDAVRAIYVMIKCKLS